MSHLPRYVCFIVCSALFIVEAAAFARAAEKKIPIIHSTDLFHPHDDPDDHYDLATLFALDEFDIKGIVLDNARAATEQWRRPGRLPVEQMMHVTGRKVPYAIGLGRRLRSIDDKALDEEKKHQAGIELIFSVLRASDEPVVYHAAGSVRNIAAAYNREPELLKRKLKAVYIEIGRGPDGEQREWNVTLDPFSFARVISSDLPVYWCPCFGREGYGTYYKADQAEVIGACAPPVRNFFVYCLSKPKADPIEFLGSGPHPAPIGERNMWCTAPLLHAAGRKIYRRGRDDYVALSPAAAVKAGLAEKVVDAFNFVPMRATVERLPELKGTGKQWVRPLVNVELNPVGKSRGYVFHQSDKDYSKILPSVLKNLLGSLGRSRSREK
ncbi:MAG: nucleoside hydrolase [Pirellulales bacterium]|nr:nucleoside hydrolase [Pirellulales bacterium]